MSSVYFLVTCLVAAISVDAMKIQESISIDRHSRAGDSCANAGNFAQNKVASQSSLGTANEATDGEWNLDTTCAATDSSQTDAWWEVNLGQEYNINFIRIQTGANFQNVNITVGSAPGPANMNVCKYYTGPPSVAQIVILCDATITGQYVRISRVGVLEICEVGAYVGIQCD